MKVSSYGGSFIKKNGDLRNMIFVKVEDLPQEFLESVHGLENAVKSTPEGMELVFDVEADNWRYFNHNTVVEAPVYLGQIDF